MHLVGAKVKNQGKDCWTGATGLTKMEVHRADATALPLPNNSIDVVISNGVLNLVREKEKAFAAIAPDPAGRAGAAEGITF